MPKAFSISFQSGVRGRGREVSSDLSCTGYDGYFAFNSGSLKTLVRVGGLPRSADLRNCSALVAQRRKSKDASALRAALGIARSQLPISACPACFSPGIVATSTLPGTFVFSGLFKAGIHAGQLMVWAAV